MTQSSQDLPRWAPVRQTFGGTPVTDVPGAVAAALAQLGVDGRVKPGQRVAVSAGSRGVANVVAVTRAAVAELRRLGAEPFVFPCMGSHGGAQPAGQLDVLTSYGLTAAAVGAPVISQGEVVPLGQTPSGVPLWCDKLAFEADHLLVINRVKPHTDFSGLIESGPTKMLAIGLGKHHGAEDCHRRFVQRGYEPVLREVGDALWARLPLLGGLGLVENGHDLTVRIGAVHPHRHEEDEAELLAYAKEVFGYLPFDELDVLLLDEIGKDISGAGLDPNVTGVDCCKTHTVPDTPRILRIGIRSLTPASHGNAAGIGQADFALQRCVDAVDWQVTATNLIVAAAPESGRCPLAYPHDQALLAAALRTIGAVTPAEVRLVRARSTLHVDRLLVSEALLPACADHPRCEVLGELQPMEFDGDGFFTAEFSR